MSTETPTTAQTAVPPNNPPVITPWYLDKALYAKMLAPILAVGVAAINHKFNVGLDANAVDIAVAGIFTSAVAYIIAHKWGATKKAEAVIQNNAKTVALVLALMLTVFSARPAEAALDYAIGPTLPLLKLDFGQNTVQTQVAPGAGLQLSLTLDALKKPLFGQQWDLLALDVMGFGSLVKDQAGNQFGQLAVAGGLSTLSSLIFVGAGVNALGPNAGHGFMLFSVGFNFAISPPASTAPPGAQAAPVYRRGNTVYFLGQ